VVTGNAPTVDLVLMIGAKEVVWAMDVEVRSSIGVTLGKGRLKDELALALRKNDEVVFPFISGCWVIKTRHLLIRQVDGNADMTLIVDPRDGAKIGSSMNREVDV
jgi:hypothetical protein